MHIPSRHALLSILSPTPQLTLRLPDELLHAHSLQARPPLYPLTDTAAHTAASHGPLSVHGSSHALPHLAWHPPRHRLRGISLHAHPLVNAHALAACCAASSHYPLAHDDLHLARPPTLARLGSCKGLGARSGDAHPPVGPGAASARGAASSDDPLAVSGTVLG